MAHDCRFTDTPFKPELALDWVGSLTLECPLGAGMRLLTATFLLALSPVLTHSTPQPPDSCPVTKPSEPPFQPPAPYPSEGSRWIGTRRLWTNVPADGVWNGLGHYSVDDPRFREKLFWWSDGYDWRTENPPKLTITGTRLDGPAPPLETDEHPNAGWNNDSDHPFIVAGIFIPVLGCWKITGEYEGEELSYVVWVSQECTPNDLLALLKPTDPAYQDATDLTSNLQSHGFIVKCVLQSTSVHLFEGQTGAAYFKTDHGDFGALFLPKELSFESLVLIEGQEKGRYLYWFEGYPPKTSSQPINSKSPMFVGKRANKLFFTEMPELAKKIVSALN